MNIEELEKKWEEEERTRPWWKKVLRSLKYIPFRNWSRAKDAYYEVKWGFQRMFRGYDDRAFWGLNSYITEIALPVLKWLKNNKHGLPWNQEVDSEQLAAKGVIDHGSYAHTEESWNAILDKMIDAFQVMHDEDYCVPDDLGAPSAKEDWPAYKKWHEDRNKRIDEGLGWFGKYFRSLWD